MYNYDSTNRELSRIATMNRKMHFLTNNDEIQRWDKGDSQYVLALLLVPSNTDGKGITFYIGNGVLLKLDAFDCRDFISTSILEPRRHCSPAHITNLRSLSFTPSSSTVCIGQSNCSLFQQYQPDHRQSWPIPGQQSAPSSRRRLTAAEVCWRIAHYISVSFSDLSMCKSQAGEKGGITHIAIRLLSTTPSPSFLSTLASLSLSRY